MTVIVKKEALGTAQPFPQRLSQTLFESVDCTSLIFFRITFYLIMLWEAWRFIENDWVGRYYSNQIFYFKYWPFEFVQVWPSGGMILHITLVGIIAISLIFGFFYRTLSAVFFILFTYLFLLEKAVYLNHLYLVCLIAFVMVFVPANRFLSLDVIRNPNLRSQVIPTWSIWILRFQVGVPYFFGGIAKLNSDWLNGEPLRAWLAARTDFPFLGQFFLHEGFVWLMVYGAIAIDLLVVFFLLNRHTRVFAYLVALAFHFMNARLFNIGIFPWTMIAITTVFFNPDWPHRLYHNLRKGDPFTLITFIGGFIFGFIIGGFLPTDFSLMRAMIGALGVAIAAIHLDEPFRNSNDKFTREKREASQSQITDAGISVKRPLAHKLNLSAKLTLALLSIWVAIQILVPLRHYLIPGNVNWTEEGHNFSWHMKLRDKESVGFFLLTDSLTGEEWVVDPIDYLTPKQSRKMTSRPDLIVQFARFLEEQKRRDGYSAIEVRARIIASLNGREFQPYIDPKIDLTEVDYPWLGHAAWIMPLMVPLEESI